MIKGFKGAYKGKKVFITGHTGFKGSWLSLFLKELGAEVMGYSLEPNTEPSLYNICNIKEEVKSIIGDIRDLDHLSEVIDEFKPDIIFHLAAQPLVRLSYKEPKSTYETNVIGTLNLYEAARKCSTIKSIVTITTDKCYENKEWPYGYRENDPMGGYDPYSSSKGCVELLTSCYRNSYFTDLGIKIATARAGNVIGGGDFAADRIVPDCVKAAVKRERIIVRNPYSTRPYQHVLEPLFAYLMIAAKQYEDIKYAGYYNVGPDDQDCFQTGALVDLFVKHWGENMTWVNRYDGGPHEANFLKLDCSKLKNVFGWKPHWNLDKAIEKTVEWSKCWIQNNEVKVCMDKQIQEFLEA